MPRLFSIALRARSSIGTDVDEPHRESRLREHLRDPVAHRARANHGDTLDHATTLAIMRQLLPPAGYGVLIGCFAVLGSGDGLPRSAGSSLCVANAREEEAREPSMHVPAVAGCALPSSPAMVADHRLHELEPANRFG